MQTVNLGILAHVDAGKTSLTERLLYAAGVIDQIGSVDDGTTHTDTLALERQRGITIKSAVVSFLTKDRTVNLIDTPGHPDFIAEVERVLTVLDGAVLVLSAVEGVQAQTRVLWRALRRLHIPTLFFVNKIDRAGAQPDRVLAEIAAKLTPQVIAMAWVHGQGSRDAAAGSFDGGDPAFTARLAEVLAEHDDDLLAACLQDPAAIGFRHLRRALAAQVGGCLVAPVFFGSAVTGAGVAAVTDGIRELLPAAAADAAGAPAGQVFKVERGAAGERVAYLRMFRGTISIRDRLQFAGSAAGPPGGARRTGRAGKVTGISVFDRGAAVPRPRVTAGQIGKLWGLDDVRIGDVLGEPQRTGRRQFAPPTLQAVVVPASRADSGALHLALTQLAEQDPLINLRQDDLRQEILVSLYGEVQKEVLQATLAGDYGLDVGFRETTTICIERPAGCGEAAEFQHVGDNPFLATVGLRVAPAAAGAGVTFRLGVELGSMPLAFFRAVEDTVYQALQQGLHGWQVTDCVITMTRSGYSPRQSAAHQRFDRSVSSTGEDFRGLTPLVLMSALQRAGTAVCEPVSSLRLEFPADCLPAVLGALARLQGTPFAPELRGSGCLLDAEIPAGRLHALQQALPSLTKGEGVIDAEFARYQPVRGAVPSRPRTGHNPLDRKDYLLQATRNLGR